LKKWARSLWFEIGHPSCEWDKFHAFSHLLVLYMYSDT